MKILASVIFQERPLQHLEWVLYILVGSMALIAISRILLSNNFDSLKKLDRFQEINDNQTIFGTLVQLLFAVLVSTLIFSYLLSDYDYIFYTPLLKVLAFSSLILVFFALRNLLGSVASFAFGISFDKNFNLKTFNFYRAYGVLILWISVLLFYFSSLPGWSVLVFAGLSLLIIRVITYLKIFNNQTEKQTKIWYYNILYLCALEILPLLVVFKSLNTW